MAVASLPARVLTVAAALVIAGGMAGAATPPDAKCAASKIKATGKKADGKLKCHAKATAKAEGVEAECLDNVEGKFASAFAKADDNGGCASTGDAGDLEAKVDDFVLDVLTALPDGGTEDGRKCAAAKMKAAGKKAGGKLKCHAKGLSKGTGVDPICLGKAEDKFAATFAKAEGKGGCATTNDVDAIEMTVDTFVADVVDTLTPVPVSFSADVQSIFTAHCTSAGCHSGALPAEGMNLTAGFAYSNIVNVDSTECPSFKRVLPGAPDSSYLVFKIEGTGPCFSGGQMPLGMTPLSAGEIDTIRTWIAEGAANN